VLFRSGIVLKTRPTASVAAAATETTVLSQRLQMQMLLLPHRCR